MSKSNEKHKDKTNVFSVEEVHRDSPPEESGIADANEDSLSRKDVFQDSRTERIGETLRKERLRQKEDIYVVTEYLRIKPSFLIALENSRYHEFPADAYIVGFIRSYAEFLGMDGKKAVDRYRKEMAGKRRKPNLHMPEPIKEGRTPSAWMIIVAILGLIAIYFVWTGRVSDKQKPPAAVAVESTPPLAITNSSEPQQNQITIEIQEEPQPEPVPASDETTETKPIEERSVFDDEEIKAALSRED
ncbi:MAG: helix-turn-helix domain-containing protein [Alphaproteobacteria bacterium]|nr:helix-turn-helix domain-containing protein [Alphaproteobacteria bacterium]